MSTEPVCTAQAIYWRDGLRWEVVLQITYYTDEGLIRGQGPYFVIGRVWSESAARVMVEDANARLARSQSAGSIK